MIDMNRQPNIAKHLLTASKKPRVNPTDGGRRMGSLFQRGMSTPRSIVATFHKGRDKSLKLWSLTVIEERPHRDGKTYTHRDEYDVEWSRAYGYLFHMSGAGGGQPVKVDGPYHVSGKIAVVEQPTRVVHGGDKPPFRSRRTRQLRRYNRTRQLRRLPKTFDVQDGEDILDWLGRTAIEQDSVYCTLCRDRFPDDSHCDHIWWCEKVAWWSTPSDRCACADASGCRE